MIVHDDNKEIFAIFWTTLKSLLQVLAAFYRFLTIKGLKSMEFFLLRWVHNPNFLEAVEVINDWKVHHRHIIFVCICMIKLLNCVNLKEITFLTNISEVVLFSDLDKVFKYYLSFLLMRIWLHFRLYWLALSLLGYNHLVKIQVYHSKSGFRVLGFLKIL